MSDTGSIATISSSASRGLLTNAENSRGNYQLENNGRRSRFRIRFACGIPLRSFSEPSPPVYCCLYRLKLRRSSDFSHPLRPRAAVVWTLLIENVVYNRRTCSSAPQRTNLRKLKVSCKVATLTDSPGTLLQLYNGKTLYAVLPSSSRSVL